MLQKAGGDRADILQMVRWHAALCDRPALSGLAPTGVILPRLKAFVDSVSDRTMRIGDYGAMLSAIGPALQVTAGALGAAAALDPLIAAIDSTPRARAKQRAHRELLLALAPLT